MTTRASFDAKLPGTSNTSSHVRHPSEDFILGGGLAKLQSGIAKLGLSSDNSELETKPVSAQDPPSTETPLSAGIVDVKQDPAPSDESLQESAKPEIVSESGTETRRDSVDKHLPSITSLLDPLNFTLDAATPPSKRKITKDNFATSKGSLSTSSTDSADPLSQLDPLWSLKK